MESSTFCEMCNSFFGLIYSRTESAPALMTFHNMQQLIDSAQGHGACHLCSLILVEISSEKRHQYLRELRQNLTTAQFIVSVWHYVPPNNLNQPNNLELGLKPILRLEEAQRRDGSGNRSIVCHFRCEPLRELRLFGRMELGRVTRKVHPSTGSWQTFNDIHYWLGECEYRHVKCQNRRRERQTDLPTRLLYVGAFDPSPEITVCESRDIPLEVTYATLSHCWGSNMSVKLLESNVEEFKQGIVIASLPKTFRDAVGLTRALGLSYLWIDSLCIIQDSRADWARECERMSQVYAGSFINIAADASSDSSGGLFRTRSWKSVVPLSIALTYRPVGWQRTPVAIYPTGEEEFSRSPLSQRAWVTQERLLAPRTIHFCEHKVVWECPDHYASESDVTGKVEWRNSPAVLADLAVPSTTYGGTDHFNRSLALPMLIYSRDQTGMNNGQEYHNQVLITSPNANRNVPADPETLFLHKWSTIVALYSAGKLSVSTDRLMAISGIARYIQRTLWRGGAISYQAGLWSHRFVPQLTWYARDARRASSDAIYIAPSWSWASHIGKVVFPNFSGDQAYRYLAELMQASMNPVGDHFGTQNPGCFIRMRGPLCRAVPASQATDEQGPTERGRMSVILLSSGLTIEFAEVIFDTRNALQASRWNRGQQCFVLLPIKKELGPGGFRPLEGIILQLTQARPPKRGEYKRIGYFKLEDFDVNSRAEQEVNRILGDGSPPVARHDYELFTEGCEREDLPDAFYHGRRGRSYEFTVI